MEPINPVNADAIRFDRYEPALRISARGQAYANPLVWGALESIATPTGRLVYDQRSATEFALIWVKRGTRGSVAVSKKDGEQTATFSFGPMLALVPALRVQRGFIRLMPFRLEPVEGGTLFLIDITVELVVPSSRRGQ